MRQSELFVKMSKETLADEPTLNAQLLDKAAFVGKLMAGVYSFLPLGLRVLRKIEDIVRQEMNKIGGQEILMATLHPNENWKKTGGWDNIDLNTLIEPTLGWDLYFAHSINDSGWIVGWGQNPSGDYHAYLLKPIPVPGALFLATLGLGVAGWKLRRRKE